MVLPKGFKHSAEFSRKQSIRNMGNRYGVGRIPVNKGKTGLWHHPKETCKKDSERVKQWHKDHPEFGFQKGHIGYWKGKTSPMKGRRRTEEQIRRNSEAQKKLYANGYISPMKGKHHSAEVKKIISIKHYRGGYKASKIRETSKRRLLGHELLNKPFPGSHGHHINRNQIVFIPKEMHEKYRHRLKNQESMENINEHVYDWMLGLPVRKPKEEAQQ